MVTVTDRREANHDQDPNLFTFFASFFDTSSCVILSVSLGFRPRRFGSIKYNLKHSGIVQLSTGARTVKIGVRSGFGDYLLPTYIKLFSLYNSFRSIGEKESCIDFPLGVLSGWVLCIYLW